MIKKVISFLAVGVMAVGLYGQAADKPGQETKADKDMKQTVTGCLSESAGSYSLATQAGETLDVMGSAYLAKHKNHTVKLTGTTSDQGGKKTLTVSKIEHVSPSCSK